MEPRQQGKWMAEVERRLRTLEASPSVPAYSVAGRGITAGQFDAGASQSLTTSFVDGPGTPLSVPIGPSGRAIVIMVVDIGVEDPAYPFANGYVSFRMTGPTVRAANLTDAAWRFASGESLPVVATVAEGLEPGDYAVMVQARSVGTIPDSFNWQTWTLIVMPL